MTGKASTGADGTEATREIVSLMEAQSAACRVLVVDDEPLIRWAIAETLADLGYSVIEAGDGETALQALAEASIPVDVILLDYSSRARDQSFAAIPIVCIGRTWVLLLPRTVTRGQGVIATRRLAMLPTNSLASPVLPWVPTTRKSARFDRTVRTIC